MEEVDRIIIDSLKHLECDIDEQITNLKDFGPNLVVEAVTTCLELINPQVKWPKKFPISMSAKIKLASNMARQIQELGFKGDMGYQTILYCNEVDVRRVLIFLIERLPKELNPTAVLEPIGHVPKILKQIDDTISRALAQMWVPSESLYYGTRFVDENVVVNSLGDSCLIEKVILVVPDDTLAGNNSCIPFIRNQCSSRQLLPSILFEESRFSNPNNCKRLLSNSTAIARDVSSDILQTINCDHLIEPKEVTNTTKPKEINKVDVLLNQLKEKKQAFKALQEVVKQNEGTVAKLKQQRENEETFLKDSIAKVKVKNKTLVVLSKDENKEKLKNLIQKAENRMMELANQWKEVEIPLLEEHSILRSSVSSESLKQQNEQNKLLNLKKTYKELVKKFKEKAALEQTLIEHCKDLNNKNNRGAYTKRILEIVGNIQKQNKEIQKVLADTKQVQKDINNLTGQIDRSFTLSDELIFHDCKHDESARKAYKMLAALREECNNILTGVSDMGVAERELRNLEEQIEVEKTKDVRRKLEKVQNDLDEIKKDMELLV